MEENKIDKQINDCVKEIVANSKDAKFAKSLIGKLKGLYKKEATQPVELIVPQSEVVGHKDFDSTRLTKTIRGYLFEIKGGVYTFVESRMSGVTAMLDLLYNIDEADIEPDDRDLFQSAILYVMQSPIFASLSQEMLFGMAAEQLRLFNEHSDKLLNRELKPETEADIEANNEMERVREGMEIIANSEPPELDD